MKHCKNLQNIAPFIKYVKMNLIQNILNTYGQYAALRTATLLDELCLPQPEEGEYTHSWDGGYLVFINPVACVLRLTHHSKIPNVSHPHIQRPLGSRYAGVLRLDINPGLTCPIDPRDAQALYQRMKENNILLWDQKIHNLGYRPGVNNPTQRVPVLIDHASIQNLSQSVSVIKRAIQAKTWIVNEYLTIGLPEKNPPPEAIEDDPYEELRICLKNSWESRSIEKFWQAAATAKESKLLIAGWLTGDMNESGYKNAFHGSQLYERKWKGPR